jgi:hypothetical protein
MTVIGIGSRCKAGATLEDPFRGSVWLRNAGRTDNGCAISRYTVDNVARKHGYRMQVVPHRFAGKQVMESLDGGWLASMFTKTIVVLAVLQSLQPD